ncbi:MAG TPA: sensor domain-containing diguanylate cyclase, partial [Candidatus Limnocylindrales bacterium]|nr:sensor domain-containing diguanylate cyclase [Candidatus Limnocylindrales bacterium]
MIRSKRLRSSSRRALGRLAGDPHVLLAIAVVLAALVIELASRGNAVAVVIPSLVYLGVQCALALSTRARRSATLDTARLLFALVTVIWMSVGTGNPATLPLASLTLPIVVMAAAMGTRQVVAVGGVLISAALALYFVPAFATPTIREGLVQRGIALAATAVVLAVGTRRTISTLERAVAHARAASAGMRRRARQISAIEAIGRALTGDGPTSEALDEVVAILVERFGYRYPSIYMRDGDLMRLGAQRGYKDVIETFDGTVGVVGRVMRTGKPQFVPDVTADPEYRAASPDVRSEVSVPLWSGDTILGVLNIESGQDAPPLDVSDLDTLVVVADRVSVALALAREREALRERAALFTRLAAFGSAVNASLDLTTAHSRIVASVAEAMQADIVTLVLRDAATGEDRIVAMHGGDDRYLGVRIPQGEGMTGQAIAERLTVSSESYERSSYPTTVKGARVSDVLAGAAVPLLGEDGVVGAVAIGRDDLGRPFSALELETMPLIGSQVTLALANVQLHARVADAAIRDPLTGLWNRRHLEVSTARLFAARARLELDDRRPIAVILFDLDHFGDFNKQHGHIVGDAVLRSFGSILSGRLRSSDIVARFGGEEFV